MMDFWFGFGWMVIGIQCVKDIIIEHPILLPVLVISVVTILAHLFLDE